LESHYASPYFHGGNDWEGTCDRRPSLRPNERDLIRDAGVVQSLPPNFGFQHRNC
jgi:hypothetical protein